MSVQSFMPAWPGDVEIFLRMSAHTVLSASLLSTTPESLAVKKQFSVVESFPAGHWSYILKKNLISYHATCSAKAL